MTVTKAENGEGYTVTALDDASMIKLKEGKERTQVIIPLDMYDWEDFLHAHAPAGLPHEPPAACRHPQSAAHFPTQVRHASQRASLCMRTPHLHGIWQAASQHGCTATSTLPAGLAQIRWWRTQC